MTLKKEPQKEKAKPKARSAAGEQCKKVKIHGGISTKEKIFFAKNLSIMINSGIPLRDALTVIKDQTRSKRFRAVLDYIVCEVENGQYLSVALATFPKIFDHLFVNLVRVGEESGQLAEDLNYISVQIERGDALLKKVRGALIYPAIVLFGTIGVAGFLTFVTLPQILPIFVSLKVTLPASTQFLFNFSHFITGNIIQIVISIVAFIVLIRLLLINNKIRFFFHHLSIDLPVFGTLIKNAQITRLSQILGTLLVAGVDVVHALDITAESLSNLVFRRELRKAAEDLKKEGVNIADCFSKTNIFPAIVIQMIRVGEKTGKLDDLFHYIAEFYTKEIDDTVNNMTTVIEPVLLLIMGVVVGFVAISVITPIYKLTEGIHR